MAEFIELIVRNYSILLFEICEHTNMHAHTHACMHTCTNTNICTHACTHRHTRLGQLRGLLVTVLHKFPKKFSLTLVESYTCYEGRWMLHRQKQCCDMLGHLVNNDDIKSQLHAVRHTVHVVLSRVS